MSIEFSQPAPPRVNPLTTRPIPDLIRTIGVPVGVGAFFNTMFNVVDTYYGGLISDEALAALSLSFPIFFIIIALSFGLSFGNTALIGNALGADDQPGAVRFAVQGIVLGVTLALLVTQVGVAVAPFLFGLLGASDSYLSISLRYINTIFYGTIFFVIAQMLNAILSAGGNTKPFRNFLVTGFILNLLLDPWFIFGGAGLPPLGIAGIALATIVVQFLGCLYLGVEVFRTGLLTGPDVGQNLWPQLKTMGEIIRQGLPNIVDLGSVSMGFFVLTFFVSRFGQEAVAAFGAAARIEQLALLPIIGLDVATLSLIAQNNGAGLPRRVTETLSTAIRYGVIIMLIGGILITVFAASLMALFSDDPDIISIGTTYIRIRAWALIPTAFTFLPFSAMRGLKKPLHALFLNLNRTVILPIIGILIMVQILDFGLVAIWWVTFVVAFLIAAIAYFHAKRLLPTV